MELSQIHTDEQSAPRRPVRGPHGGWQQREIDALKARIGEAERSGDSLRSVFDQLALELGAGYAENLHCHFSKIMYTDMGEKKHLTFDDDIYGPNFEPLAEAIIAEGVCPRIICESDGTMSDDALAMKQIWLKLLEE